ncbi:DEAD/DEAH box helicase family protein [Paenarthrobacter sp. AR 02]|uniref:DEAD/DEAH box helicase family protein n=1 Tax=Paenarthrobacter sp. AR 02 TaxID=2899821 RepID=UPI001F20EB0D|nr:DEAD/DEAH box helicase family protein [Paenarthrobacter sp. AR 02]MCF3140817.1 DEAD/DEAH box helicase family protein [Paenarthrobacter sp. AR 02]
MKQSITFDRELLDDIASRLDLRLPNRTGLAATVKHLAQAVGDYVELVNDLATGVGKTFLMVALVEYLAVQGVRNVLIVTPGSTIQKKTLANFDRTSSKFISGGDHVPLVITPENFRTSSMGAALHDGDKLKLFVFNVQQLIRPKASNSRRVYEVDENLGDALYDHLQGQDDLIVITDEHHVYHDKAASFSAAIRSLSPMALVGLTATPAKADEDKVVFQYTLAEAIADGLVKVPVLVYRQDGMKDERTRLSDACHLLRRKDAAYRLYSSEVPGAPSVKPALFVVCQDIEHAGEVGQLLAGPEFIGDPNAVLEITSQSSDEALAALDAVESPDSPIRAIVSVNMLREGWDVKNIAVIAALRKLDSEMLTEQVLGRGLRLPFGKRTNIAEIDQVDLVAHDSYQKLLAKKDILNERLQPKPRDELERTLPFDWSKAPEEQPAAIPEDLPEYDSNGQPGLFSLLPDLMPSNPDSLVTPGSGLKAADLDKKLDTPGPEKKGRVEGAPTIVFPLEKSRLVQTQFTLSTVADQDARSLGQRYSREIPLFMRRVALEAERRGDDVGVIATPQDQVEAIQSTAPLDTVREELIAAVMARPEVESTKAQRGAAKRIVDAFLAGAGATHEDETAVWSENRKKMAVEGLRGLIREAVSNRKTERQRILEPVVLPLEPVLVDPSLPGAYDGGFIRRAQYKGWRRNIMPIASFDAKSTEWEIAHIIDNDSEVAWWLRLDSQGPVWIPTDEAGRYFPDFIAIDKRGTRWIIEGKSDKESTDPGVLHKKAAAQQWARSVRDEDDEQFGQWRYMFITETDVKRSSGSWNGLLTVTNPE